MATLAFLDSGIEACQRPPLATEPEMTVSPAGSLPLAAAIPKGMSLAPTGWSFWASPRTRRQRWLAPEPTATAAAAAKAWPDRRRSDGSREQLRDKHCEGIGSVGNAPRQAVALACHSTAGLAGSAPSHEGLGEAPRLQEPGLDMFALPLP